MAVASDCFSVDDIHITLPVVSIPSPASNHPVFATSSGVFVPGSCHRSGCFSVWTVFTPPARWGRFRDVPAATPSVYRFYQKCCVVLRRWSWSGCSSVNGIDVTRLVVSTP